MNHLLETLSRTWRQSHALNSSTLERQETNALICDAFALLCRHHGTCCCSIVLYLLSRHRISC